MIISPSERPTTHRSHGHGRSNSKRILLPRRPRPVQRCCRGRRRRPHHPAGRVRAHHLHLADHRHSRPLCAPPIPGRLAAPREDPWGPLFPAALHSAPRRRAPHKPAQVRHHVAQGHGLRHHGAGRVPAHRRRPPAPPPQALNPHECVPFIDDLFSAGHDTKLEALPSPRLLSTHMQHSLLPASLAENTNAKIVYICREPKDMLVSMWHFANTIHPCHFSDLFESICEGKSTDGPMWDHLLGYWRASKANPERVLFLRYEEVLLNPVDSVIKLAQFLMVPFSAADEAVGLPADIVKLCSIKTMKGLQVNKTGASGLFYKFPHESFFRKGVTGDWVNHMTPEMAQRLDAIVDDKLCGSGLSFSS